MRKICLASLALCVLAHCATPGTSAEGLSPKVAIPREIQQIPAGYFDPSPQPGTLQELTYQTYESFSYRQKSRTLQKRAIIYLPHGHQKDQPYDVFYLMHGGWGDEAGTLGTPDKPSRLKSVIDHAVAAGDIRPLIIVCPTYNNTNENGRDSANFSLAMQLTENFPNELVNDLIPAVEGRYRTFAATTRREDVVASRDHRGFGGFSMGSVATWRTFQYALDEFRYFLPMSCGTTLNDEQIFAAASGRRPEDYFVFVMTGTSDFAYTYDQSRAQRMGASRVFVDVDRSANGNFAYRVKQGYSHNGTAAMEYTYNGMKAFWGGKAAAGRGDDELGRGERLDRIRSSTPRDRGRLRNPRAHLVAAGSASMVKVEFLVRNPFKIRTPSTTDVTGPVCSALPSTALARTVTVFLSAVLIVNCTSVPDVSVHVTSH